MKINFKNVLICLTLLFAAQAVRGQERVAASDTHTSPAGPVAVKATAPFKKQEDAECRFCRWLDVQSATVSARFRFVEDSRGVTTNKQLQDNVAVKARFKFDPKGNYSVNVGLFSGNSFTGGWNNTGVGTGRLFTNLYVKQLYLSAKPAAGVEAQYGSLYVQRGENTEITSYDNDAYLMGGRVVVRRPKQLYFDEVSATYAYVGDLSKPSVFRRLGGLKRSNYHQFQVSKKFGKRAGASADYSFQGGVETMREGVKVNTPELRVLDSVRFETYQRADVRPDYGFAFGVEKTLAKRLTLGGGYARIDRNYGGLNGDRFNKGKRLFASAAFNLSPEFSVNTFATRAFDNDFAVGNRTRFDLIFGYNFLKTLKRTGLF